jgi:hypothetical protein
VAHSVGSRIIQQTPHEWLGKLPVATRATSSLQLAPLPSYVSPVCFVGLAAYPLQHINTKLFFFHRSPSRPHPLIDFKSGKRAISLQFHYGTCTIRSNSALQLHASRQLATSQLSTL